MDVEITNAGLVLATAVVGFFGAVIKLIHELFRSRRPTVGADLDRHFKALFSKLDRQSKAIEEMRGITQRHEGDIAVHHKITEQIAQDVRGRRT